MPEFRNPRYVRVDPRGGVDPVGAVTRVVEPFAYAFFLIIIGGTVWWLYKQVAFAAGSVVIGYVVGRVLVRALFRKVRRAFSAVELAPRQSVESRRQAPPLAAGRQAPPVAAGGQHLHLHLPEGTTAQDVARIMRGGA